MQEGKKVDPLRLGVFSEPDGGGKDLVTRWQCTQPTP